MRYYVDQRKSDALGYYVVCYAEIRDNKVDGIHLKVYPPDVYNEFKMLCDI